MTLRALAVVLGLVVALVGERAAYAQLELPAPSPRARVDQRVGLTDFQLEYSSPGVKKRVIWGRLVPHGKLWRTGANQATKLTVSRDFQLGNKRVKAGAYALYTIPKPGAWTVILNTNAETWGTGGYDAKKDVARITVRPARAPSWRERLTFVFTGTTDFGTSLDLEWARLRVRIPIKVDTRAHAAANIERETRSAWQPHMASARWLLDSGGNLDRALTLIDKSIAIEATWWNHWIKAQILGKKGRAAEAVAMAQKAHALGKGNATYEGNFKVRVDKAIASWRR